MKKQSYLLLGLLALLTVACSFADMLSIGDSVIEGWVGKAASEGSCLRILLVIGVLAAVLGGLWFWSWRHRSGPSQ